MEWLWVRDILLWVGWLALLAAPIAHERCWFVARTCAMLMAFGWLIAAGQAFDGRMLIQLIGWRWPEAMATSSSARELALLQFQLFNLFVASWQVEDSRRHQIPHFWLLPGLVSTATFGPWGLITHMAIRDYFKLRQKRSVATQ